MYVCMLTEIITCVYRQSTITTPSLPVQANTAASQQSENNLGNSNNNNKIDNNNNNNNIMKGSFESQHRNNGAKRCHTVCMYMYVCMHVCMYSRIEINMYVRHFILSVLYISIFI